jgi:hypothetical protein
MSENVIIFSMLDQLFHAQGLVGEYSRMGRSLSERDYEPLNSVFTEAILRAPRVDKAGQRRSHPGKLIQDQPRSRESPRSPKRK